MKSLYRNGSCKVRVTATARLHMGFIDLNGGLGRRFGSIGLALESPFTCIEVQAAEQFACDGPMSSRVLEFAQSFAKGVQLPGAAHIRVVAAIPEHAGLGSGTQLGLALAAALARLYDRKLDVSEMAATIGRGRRSGIGIAAFERGGLLVDGGRGDGTSVPPILARLTFPEDWPILLVFDPRAQGVHGSAETRAFDMLPDFPAPLAAHIARLVLMQALPAVVERDLQAFGLAISEIQRRVGDHFAQAQGGGRYISPRVAQAMAWLEAQGVFCLGQTSWGPTGFAVVEDDVAALRLKHGLEARNHGVEVKVTRARNAGSQIEVAP
ncbi:MAG: GHMP kinase [Methylophilaceae bacterium]|nr:GHMP kinase [Methylophilaceae bacterium]